MEDPGVRGFNCLEGLGVTPTERRGKTRVDPKGTGGGSVRSPRGKTRTPGGRRPALGFLCRAVGADHFAHRLHSLRADSSSLLWIFGLLRPSLGIPGFLSLGVRGPRAGGGGPETDDPKTGGDPPGDSDDRNPTSPTAAEKQTPREEGRKTAESGPSSFGRARRRGRYGRRRRPRK